jgi:inosine-uridine nucleoside N-ribohydrolase
MVKKIEAAGTPVARYVAKFAVLTLSVVAIMWDELAAAAWIDPTIITHSDTRYMSVDLGRGAGYGNTLTWASDDKFHPDTQLVEIQLDLNMERFYSMFVSLMTAPAPGR